MAPHAATRRAATGAALAAVFLVLGFAASPAAAVAGTTCIDQTVTLVPNDPRGGCSSIGIAPATLFTDSSNNATVTFTAGTGTTPATPPLTNGLYVFNAGTVYKYTVTGAATCTGTVTVNPCDPVCQDWEVEVKASVSTSCQASVGVLTGANPDFFDLSTIGANAISATMTPPTGGSTAPAKYGVGVTAVTAKVKYPGMTSVATASCKIKVIDASNPPAPTPLNTCFYRNDTSNRACVPLSKVAKPAAGSCGNGAKQRIIAATCEPHRIGTRGARICVMENKPATSKVPVPSTAVCVARSRIGSKRVLTLSLGVSDVNNILLSENYLETEITLYPSKRAVPEADLATCIAVTKKF